MVPHGGSREVSCSHCDCPTATMHAVQRSKANLDMGSHIGGALGGAIAAQPAVREIGGVSRYRGAIAAIVSPIAV